MVGLVLANARGTSLARRLWTRWRVGLFTAALSFTWLALMLWLWLRGSRPEHTLPADWTFRLQQVTLAGLIVQAGLMALMLWSMPSSAARKADGGTRDAIRLACFH
jgi:hypothetical protein